MKRVLFGIFLILLTFISPWWIPFLFSILGLFYFENLYEVILVGLIIDTLYGAQHEIFGFSLIFTAGLTLCFYIIGKFKTQIFI
jgi:hypothetical protein